MDALPDGHKNVISGRYFDGVQTQVLAEQLELKLEACKKRLQRGRAMLAECLRKKGVLSAAEVTS